VATSAQGRPSSELVHEHVYQQVGPRRYILVARANDDLNSDYRQIVSTQQTLLGESPERFTHERERSRRLYSEK